MRNTDLAQTLINAHQLANALQNNVEFVGWFIAGEERLARRRAASSCNASQLPPL